MAAKEIMLPDTMISPETGETLKRDIRPFEVSYKGEKIIVSLPGYYPENEGDGVHVGKDMSVVDNALRELKESIEGGADTCHDQARSSQTPIVSTRGGSSVQSRRECIRQV